MIIQLYARHITSVLIISKHCTHCCRRSAIPKSYTLSLRLANITSPHKRPTTLSYHKLYRKCFTSRHHVISNKIHDLTTLCASCHECFDCIKTFHTSCHRSYRSLHHNPSSLRLVNNTSSKNFARISIVDRFDLFKSLKL